MGLPLSSVSSRASSSAFWSTRSPSFHRTRERSIGFIFAHGPSNAARAARTARSTSSAPASATVVMGSSVAGFVVVSGAPEAASTASPLMIRRPGFTGASVSDISFLHWDQLPDACLLDLLRVVTVVLREPPHHVGERVPATPDVVGVRRDLGEPEQQQLALRVQTPDGRLPAVGAERRQVRLVDDGLLLVRDARPGARLAAERPAEFLESHAVALREVQHDLLDGPLAGRDRPLRTGGRESLRRRLHARPRAL